MASQFGKDVAMDGVRSRTENLGLAILVGVIAAAIGAAIWMAVKVGLRLHSGLVALAVGAVVGLAVRAAGNGRGMIYGIVGALLTLAGCIGGEILAMVAQTTSAQRDFYATLTTIDVVQVIQSVANRSSAIDYVFYAIGIFAGYKLSIRK